MATLARAALIMALGFAMANVWVALSHAQRGEQPERWVNVSRLHLESFAQYDLMELWRKRNEGRYACLFGNRPKDEQGRTYISVDMANRLTDPSSCTGKQNVGVAVALESDRDSLWAAWLRLGALTERLDWMVAVSVHGQKHTIRGWTPKIAATIRIDSAASP